MSLSNLIAIICAAAACSCTSQYMEIGNNWTEVNERVVMIDTCSVDISSIVLDSVKTSGGNAVYAGIRESSYWGRMALSSYLTFKLTEDFEDSSTPEYEEKVIFDSLILYMVPDSTFCGDTLLPMTLQAFRLSETVELNDDEELYSHSEFGYDSTPIAEETFYPRPFRGIWDHCFAASAELVVHPLPGSYCKQNYSSLPSTLNLYIMDENNISTGGAIIGNDGETLQSGSLTYDDMMFPENTYYTYDITDFINDQFGKIGVNKQYLQMIDPEYGYTLGELIIPDRYTTDCQIKLIIKLALYDE